MIQIRRWGLILGLALLALWGVARSLQTPALAANSAALNTTNVLYRFDPGTQTFITIPLPIGSWPTDLEISGTNPTQIWVADSGLGQITRILYTSTLDYHITHFSAATTVSNQPYRLAIGNGRVWFTARNTNRIGRLDPATGTIDEFTGNGLPANAGLTDIKVAPNGRVWIGAESARQLLRLTVTSTVSYAFRAYTDTLRPSYWVAPYAIALAGNDYVLMTVPTAPTPTLRLARLTAALGLFEWPTLETNSFPQDVNVLPGEIWFSDRQRNELVQLALETMTTLNPHGPISKPTGLTTESSSSFWSILQTTPAALGHLSYGGQPPVDTVTTFNLPDARLTSSAIGLAADGGVWLSAYRAILYLPIIQKS